MKSRDELIRKAIPATEAQAMTINEIAAKAAPPFRPHAARILVKTLGAKSKKDKTKMRHGGPIPSVYWLPEAMP